MKYTIQTGGHKIGVKANNADEAFKIGISHFIEKEHSLGILVSCVPYGHSEEDEIFRLTETIFSDLGIKVKK